MKLKRRILIVSSEFPPQPGGIGNHAYNLAKGLCKKGFEVTVLVDCRSDAGQLERSFDKIQDFDVKRIATKHFRALMYLRRLVLFFKYQRNNDVLIASGKFSLWLVGLTKWYHKKKCLAVIHGSEVNMKSHLPRFFTEKALGKFNNIIAVSKYTKQFVDHLHLKVRVIPNGYDSDIYKLPNNYRKLKSDNLQLITVGRLSERKGQGQVIEHLPYILKKYPKAHYHCIGIDKEKDVYLALAKQLNVEKSITFHGSLPIEELMRLIVQSDIKVMLSTTSNLGDVEGFGIAIIEANALGIPAIGSKHTGIEDAILHGKSGMLIESKDQVAFLNAINTIMEDKQSFEKEALIWAEQHKWDYIINDYVNGLEEL